MNTELQHYGVLGMKWGRRRGKALSSTQSKKAKKQKDDKNTKAKITKGAKIAATILGISGTVAVGAFMINRAHAAGKREGILAAQKEASMFRRAAAAKGVATRAANAARLAQAKTKVDSTLSSIGRLNVQDFISMVR